MAAIDLACKAIVGLIKAYGEILKGLVKVAFAAFPEIAKKITAKIDQAIKNAEKAVNALADGLKKGIAAVLDFLASTLDTILAAYQAIFNAVLDVVGAVVNLLLDVLQKIGYLVSAAMQMPDHFWGQMSEEVLGMDLTKPLPFERTPEDCAKGVVPGTVQGNAPSEGGGDLVSILNKSELNEHDVAVDNVAPFDLDPEFLASLNLQDGGEIEFGESNDPANSMEAIKAELAGETPQKRDTDDVVSVGETATSYCDDPQTAQAKLEEMMAKPVEGATGTQKQGEPAKQGDIPANMKTIGPLTVGQRAQYMIHQMKQGVQQWFDANWGKLLAGAIAGLTGFIALNILTGGAVMAAVPPLLQILGAVMAGVAMVQVAGYVGGYFSQGWAGEIESAAKSLARAVAVGAVELVFALLFNAGAIFKALKGGVKGATKAAVNSVKTTLKGGVKGVAKTAANSVKTTLKTTAESAKDLAKISRQGAKTAFKNGKLVFKGVKGGFAKGVKSLDDLATRLKNKLGFNKYMITFRNRVLALWGHINPWKRLAFTIVDDDIPMLSTHSGRSSDEIKKIIGKSDSARSIEEKEFFIDALKRVTNDNISRLSSTTGRSADEIKKIIDNAESFRSGDEISILSALQTLKTGGTLSSQEIQHLDDIFRRVSGDLRSPVTGATIKKTGRFIQFTEESIEHIGIRHMPEMFDPVASLNSLTHQGITDPSHLTHLFPPGIKGDRELTTLIRQAIEKSRVAKRDFEITIRGCKVKVWTGGISGGAGYRINSIYPISGKSVTLGQIQIWATEVNSGLKTLEQVRAEIKALF